jgi:hypothetical protein
MGNGPIIAVRLNSDGYTVAVEPADPSRPPQRFPDKRAAWGATGGLKLVLGIPKVDLTGEGARDGKPA